MSHVFVSNNNEITPVKVSGARKTKQTVAQMFSALGRTPQIASDRMQHQTKAKT